MSARRVMVVVCRGPECGDKRDSASVHRAFGECLRDAPPANVDVHLDWQSCFGRCARGVNVMVRELRPGEERQIRAILMTGLGGTVYSMVQPREVPRIVREHVEGGAVIQEFRGREPPPDPPAPSSPTATEPTPPAPTAPTTPEH